MEFLTKTPLYSGVVSSPEKRSKELSLIMAQISYRNLKGILALTRKTSLGYEWRLYPLDTLENLFTLDARENHIRYRRRENYTFSISLVDSFGKNQFLLPFEGYLTILGKIKSEK